MFNIDLNRSTEEILKDVRDAALVNATPELKLGIIAAPFATLLVKLGQEAEQTAQTISKLTKGLLRLTVALLALTVALLVIQGYQIYQDSGFDSQSAQGQNHGQAEQHVAPVDSQPAAHSN